MSTPRQRTSRFERGTAEPGPDLSRGGERTFMSFKRNFDMSLHTWFGRHVANLKTSHWQEGAFVSNCTLCGREMIKPPGLEWKLRGNDD